MRYKEILPFLFIFIFSFIYSLLVDFSLYSIFFFIVVSILLYLAYYDLLKMEVHNILSLSLLLGLCLINLYFFYTNGFAFEQMLGKYIFSPLNNLQGGILLGIIFQLIVLVSKEKALGQGDVRIALIVGLLVGFNNIIPWLYITVFSAIIYSVFWGIKVHKFRGLKIPFVPFMILGVLITVLL